MEPAMKEWKAALVMLLLGFFLYAQPGLAAKKTDENTPAACQDKEDNDKDDLVDCNDPDCAVMVFCKKEEPPPPPEPKPEPPPPPPKESTPEACQDGQDNDNDRFADCADQDCSIFTFCIDKAPGTGTGEVEPGPEPHKSDGGFGVYISGQVYARAKTQGDYSGDTNYEEIKIEPAAGLGLFGELFVNRFVALGGEVYVAFPKIDKSRAKTEGYAWSEWGECPVCQTNVLFAAMFRMRFPIPAGRWVAFYPILSVGVANWARRVESADTANYVGVFYTPGVGIEFRTPAAITPFIDIRYGGAVGWTQDIEDPLRPGVTYDQTGFYHSVLLNFGYRIF
jgi:hypothetical protein